MVFENSLQIGVGAYSTTEIAKILRLPIPKIRRWMQMYWDDVLSEIYGTHYTWNSNGAKTIGFHTLIEFYVMMQLSEAGVKPKPILKAHQALSKWFNTITPFANKQVLQSIRTDAKHVYFQIDDLIISLDGTRQLNMKFIELFFQRLDFDMDDLATRFYPLGRTKSIVIDPKRKLGQPTIANSNIYPETLYNHFKAGDPIAYIAHIYELSESQVQNALEYCQAA